MALPWLRVLNAIIGISDVARVVKGRSAAATADRDELAAAARGGPLEARLAGVVVAALKEAFDRDHQRMELEREQIEAERQRAERALRLELIRQAGDREVGRLRLLAGIAVTTWLGTLFFSARLVEGPIAGRALLGLGWLLLLGALAAAFVAQSNLTRALSRINERATAADVVGPGTAGALALWLIVGGLAVIGVGVLIV